MQENLKIIFYENGLSLFLFALFMSLMLGRFGGLIVL